MSVHVRLRANSAVFESDLQQYGHVLFPGAHLTIETPAPPGAVPEPAIAGGPAATGEATREATGEATREATGEATREATREADGVGDGSDGTDKRPDWHLTLTALPMAPVLPGQTTSTRPDQAGAGQGEADWPGALTWQVTVEVAGPDGQASSRVQELQARPEWSPRQYEHQLRRAARRLMLAAVAPLTGVEPGWGTLTGVRPTKLVHDLLDRGWEPAAIREHMATEYRVREDKLDLVMAVAQRQRSFLHHAAGDPDRYDPRSISVYIGIPYCPTICSFCSFSIYPVGEHRSEVPDFLAALHRELAIIGQTVAELGLRIESLYLGGGTPTSPADADFAALLEQIDRHLLRGRQPREYTVEGGRPETFNRNKLDAMAAHGVTRVSVNPQTTVQSTLKHLGRIHTVEKFYRAYDLVRRHPHPFVVNCDLIIGLPGEGPAEVAHSLADMRRLAPDNLTVHTLAVKRGSRLHEAGAGPEVLSRLTPAEAEAMVAEAAATARAMGQLPYYLYRQKYMVGSLENVGYARPGTESIYNIQMMERRQTVIGLGGGATSAWFYAPANWLLKAPANPNHPASYMARVEELAAVKVQHLRLLFGGRE